MVGEFSGPVGGALSNRREPDPQGVRRGEEAGLHTKETWTYTFNCYTLAWLSVTFEAPHAIHTIHAIHAIHAIMLYMLCYILCYLL